MRFYTNFTSMLFAILIAMPVMAEEKDTIKVGDDLGEVSVIGFKQERAALSPVSQSSVGNLYIQNNQLDGLRELSGRMANFYMPDYGSRQYSPIYIRGIGSKTSTPSVGVYVDGMPYFDRSVLDMDLFGISKVEILRGPQGTLFGRNSTAGLINIYTHSPLDYQNTMAKISYGSYNDIQAMASTYQKLSNSFGFSVAGNYHHNDGYFMNTYLNKKADPMDNGTIRIGLAWKPSQRWLMRYSLNLDVIDQGGFPYAIYDSKKDALNEISYDEASGYHRFVLSTGMNWRYEGDKFSFNSQSSFQYSKDKVSMDQDFTKKHSLFVSMPQHQNMFSQEFTFRSKNDHWYHWMTGVFAFTQTKNFATAINYFTPKHALRAKGTKDNENEIPVSGLAAYHVSSFDLYKGLSASLGIRYDYETSKVDNHTYWTPENNPSGKSKLLVQYNEKMYSNQITPRFTLKQQFTPNKMVYLTVARGYKPGGFNAAKESEADRSYAPEYTWNYEIGTKLNFIENRLSLEASAFYVDWKDQQLSVIVPTVGAVIRNIGHSDSKGFEVSLSGQPLKNLLLYANYGYTYVRFLAANTGKKRDYTGNILPMVPRHTVSLNANYSLYQLGMLDRLMFNANLTGMGKIYWHENNEKYQPFYALLNLKVAATKGHFTWELWTKNTTATKYMAYYFVSSQKMGQPGKPFCIGTSLVYTLK